MNDHPTQRPLAGKHAFVTGAARGLGAAIARELARLGADLSLTARAASTLEATCEGLAESFSIRINKIELDLLHTEALPGAVAEAAEKLGPVHILVNNAGAATAGPIGKLSLEDWRAGFELNVTAPFVLTQAVLPAMRDAGWGRIINIASTSGLTGYSYVTGYVASKHALVGFTRALALELAKTPITVNAVCPGYANTDLAADAIANLMAGGKSEDQARAILTAKNPQGRLIEPEEVAQTVGWLALPGAASMTGQAIAVAGGEVM